MRLESSGAGGDGHLVVVQDNQHIAFQLSEVVHCFKGHAACHASVAYDGNHLFFASLEVPC